MRRWAWAVSIAALGAASASGASAATVYSQTGVFSADQDGFLSIDYFGIYSAALSYSEQAAGGSLFNPVAPQVVAPQRYVVKLSTTADIVETAGYTSSWFWDEQYQDDGGVSTPIGGDDHFQYTDASIAATPDTYSFDWTTQPTSFYTTFPGGNLSYKSYTLPGDVYLEATAAPSSYGASYVFTISTVPEPATWGMMLVGFGALGLAIRKRRTALG
jgi:hypothetical protein